MPEQTVCALADTFHQRTVDSLSASGSAWTFTGFINSYSNPIDREGLITADITIRVVGEPDFNPI